MKVVRLIFIIMSSTLSRVKRRGGFFKQTGNHLPQLRHFVLLLLSLVIILSGCTSTRVLQPYTCLQDGVATQLKNESIVLLRLKADLNGKPLDPFAYYGLNGFRLELANIDDAQYLNSIDTVVSPTPKARGNGWMYLVLKPGTYYLSVIPPGSEQRPQAVARGTYSIQDTYGWCRRTYPWGRSANSKFEPIPPFWFHVPAGSPAVYVGSLSVSCMGREKKFSTYISECSEITVTNESHSAKKIAQSSFSQYGTMSTSLMKQYGKPVTPFTVGELVPMAIKITPLNLMKQGESCETGVDVTNMGKPPSVMKNIAKGSLTFTGAMCLEFLNLFLLYAGGEIIPGEITYALMDDFFEGKAQNRQDQLSIQELQDIPKPTIYLDPTATLLHTLKEILSKYGVNQTVDLVSKSDLSAQASIHKLKTVLQAEILRVQLGLCEISSFFCVELSIRIKLLDISTNKYLYDGIFFSTNPFGREKYFRRSFVIPIFGSSDCLNIEYYCSKEGLKKGLKMIEGEITEAIQFSVERFCQDLGLKP